MTVLKNEEIAELKQLAAKMHGTVADVEDIWECREPTGRDEACPVRMYRLWLTR